MAMWNRRGATADSLSSRAEEKGKLSVGHLGQKQSRGAKQRRRAGCRSVWWDSKEMKAVSRSLGTEAKGLRVGHAGRKGRDG